MANPLRKPISIRIKVSGVDEPVNVLVTSVGLNFSVAGCRKKTFTPWHAAAKAGVTETDVPSFVFGRPLEFLQHESVRVRRKRNAENLAGE